MESGKVAVKNAKTLKLRFNSTHNNSTADQTLYLYDLINRVDTMQVISRSMATIYR